MGSKVEQLVVERRRWLAGQVIGLLLWMGANVLRDAFPENAGTRLLLTVASVMGSLIWMFFMWRINVLQIGLRSDPIVAHALEDELVRANRFKAASVAMVALLLFQGAMIGILAFKPHLFSALAVAEANLLIGNVAFVGTFLYLDSKEG